MMSLAGEQSLQSFLETGDEISFKPGTPLADIEKVVILETLRQQRFNRTRAARVLGIGIRTLQRRLKEYRVDDSFDSPLMQQSVANS